MNSESPLMNRVVLVMAIANKDIERIENMLRDFPEIMTPAIIEFSPLHDACFNNDVEMVDILLKNGAKPNVSLPNTKYEILPLHDACYNGNVKMAEVLLKYGADPCLILHGTMYDISPLTICRIIDSKNHSDIEELLREYIIMYNQTEYANKQVTEKLNSMSVDEITDIRESYKK